MSSKNKTINIIILLTAVLVLTTAVYYFKNKQKTKKQTQSASISSIIHKTLVQKKQKLPIDIRIHEGHGTIIEGYTAAPETGKVIVHIQDIHTNYEAQKNMAKIIEQLIQEKNLKLILVEGGWGDVSLTYMREYADKEHRQEVAEEYLEEGKITGEEYLNIVSDYDMEIQGIEEEDLYKKNLDVYFNIENFRADGTSTVASLNEATEAIKKRLYPEKALKLEAQYKQYEEEELTLGEYYEYLTKTAQGLGVDIAQFPNFYTFIELAELEKGIDFAKVEKERTIIIEQLSKILPKEALTPLVTASLEFRLNKISPAEYHTYLQKTAEEAKLSLKKYQDLINYTEYIKAHENINTNALFKEARELEEAIKNLLIVTEQQKKIKRLSRALEILNNFLNLKLIPEDFSYYKENSQDFTMSEWLDFLKNQAVKQNIIISLPANVAELDQRIPELVGFYNLANQRDEVFMKKTLALMEEKAQKIAVLIAGGFHTPNLTKMMRENEVSYVVIAPKTTQKTDPEQYRYILEYKSGRTE